MGWYLCIVGDGIIKCLNMAVFKVEIVSNTIRDIFTCLSNQKEI